MEKRISKNLPAFRFKRFTGKSYAAFNSLRKVINIGVISGCAIVFIPSTPCIGQNNLAKEKEPESLEKELDEVMVSASRAEMPINHSAKLITVITKEQLAQAPVQSLQDLLVYIANIDAVQRGGHGVQSGISIRGGSSDQTAILLNGVNISNSQTGHYSFDFPVNLSDIQRIEILNGPSALIYGASAFSGGINIITDKTDKTRIHAKIEGGMHNLRKLETRVSSKKDKFTQTLSASYSSSDGYIENTDYSIYNLLAQSRLKINESSKIDLLLGYNEKKYGANTFYSAKYPNQYEHTNTYLSTLKGEFGKVFRFMPIVYWSRHYDNFQLERGTNFGENFHQNDLYGGNFIVTYRSKLGNSSLGSEIRKESILSSVLGKNRSKPEGKYKKYDDRMNTSLAFEHQYSFKRFIVAAGILANHNSLEKGEVKIYPSLNMSFHPNDDVKIYGSWNKSTRMPTFTDLYYTTETHESNVSLKSEKSESIDLGMKLQKRAFNLYLNGFVMKGRDIIDWVKTSPTAKPASWNHTKFDKWGMDMGFQVILSDLTSLLGKECHLNIDYSRLHQSVDSKELISTFSLNHLRDKFTIRFNHAIVKDLSVNWNFRYQKRMGVYEKFENKQSKGVHSYPAFSTLDMKINYNYKKNDIYLKFNNLYDTHYFDIGNIPQAGFWMMAGYSYSLHK